MTHCAYWSQRERRPNLAHTTNSRYLSPVRVFWLIVSGCVVLSIVGAPPAVAQTLGQVADQDHGCTTNAVKPLARHLAKAQSCIYPSELVEIQSGSGLTISSNALPYASPQTRTAVYAARKKTSFTINSAFRTLVEQYYLSTANAPACGSVAPPGTSNHESGAAIDVVQYSSARSALVNAGCSWPNISNDPWHFNCPPFNAKKRTVLAFQKLWNMNNPNDKIAEDGSFGPTTRSRLRKTPMAGFPYDGCGPNCTSGRGDSVECGELLLDAQPVAYAPPSSTDIDGDGREDLCARAAAGLKCWTSNHAGWGEGWDNGWPAIPWTDANGWNQPKRYATLRMGDIDGDGRADACARGANGVECAVAGDESFSEPMLWNGELTDESGWSAPTYYTTIRLADIDGDGRDDLCARRSTGFVCWLSDGASFSTKIEGPAWSNDAGFDKPHYYGTLRMADINGDARADVCIRATEGIQCSISTGEAFLEPFSGPAWSDANGYTGREYWSTLRFADVSNDGRADLCIRTKEDYRCHLSEGELFAELPVMVGNTSDGSPGWADPSNYETFRVGDIDGDGANDICARSNEGMQCWSWRDGTFAQSSGPAWSDSSSWNSAKYYQTVRMGDFNGDGRADLCARAAAGWRCHPSHGNEFGDEVSFKELENDTGWGKPEYWSTIMFGSISPGGMATSDGADGGVGPVLKLDSGVTSTRDGGVGAGPDGEVLNGPKMVSTCSARRDGVPWSFGVFLLLAIAMRRRN